MRFIIEWPTRKDLWDRYMEMRQKNQATGDDTARGANQFHLDNQAEMDAGAAVGNASRYITDLAPDGTPLENSALQSAYNIIADKGLEHFQTEYQNDPPSVMDIQQLYLTTYHIRANCRTGLDRGVVRENTICLTCGADVGLYGLHVVTIAWSDAAAGSIIDFSTFPFETDGRPAAACEKIIFDGLQQWWDGVRTHPWGQLDDREGTGWVPDLTLIDSGWKDKEWGTEPVYMLTAQARFKGILPCRGRSPWQQRAQSDTCFPMPGANLSFKEDVRRVAEAAERIKPLGAGGFTAGTPADAEGQPLVRCDGLRDCGADHLGPVDNPAQAANAEEASRAASASAGASRLAQLWR